MRIDTSEPSLTALFNKGQVGLIRTEFMRKDDVIAGLRAENTALWGEKDALAAEKEAETRATFDAIRTITQLRDDYAALAAENERLKASQLSLEKWIACEQAHFETADNLREKLYQASVQIERLRQAGDVLMQCYCAGDLVKEEWKQLPSVAQWIAAKEGRDAK